MPFLQQQLPSGHEGGAVAVNVRARLPSPGPSQLSDSSSRRKRAGAPSPLGEMRNPTNRRRLHRRERLCPATPGAGHFATYSADAL
jgi:hypothetical protein